MLCAVYVCNLWFVVMLSVVCYVCNLWFVVMLSADCYVCNLLCYVMYCAVCCVICGFLFEEVVWCTL